MSYLRNQFRVQHLSGLDLVRLSELSGEDIESAELRDLRVVKVPVQELAKVLHAYFG